MQEQATRERRKRTRSPSYLAGRITAGRGLVAMECVVRNSSDAGARLIVADHTRLPDVFRLHIPRKDRAYQVRACWRRRDHVGVEIMPFETTDAAVPLTMARRLKRLEAENAALKQQLAGTD
jgi:hypothetical protein